jgi:hypothetical protein
MSALDLAMTGYCGLYCTDCFWYKKTVSEAAKSLRREMRAAKLKEAWKDIRFPVLGEYESFKKSLDGLTMIRCTKACREGGGDPWCKIRRCAQKKAFDGCWQCSDIETCSKLKGTSVKVLKEVKKALR